MFKELVNFITQQLQENFGNQISSCYLVGSYAQGNVSKSRPDINWLLIWEDPPTGKEIWTLGEILTNTVNKFEDSYIVRPEFRPFKFSYPIKRGQKEVFINITNVVSANTQEKFKKKNSYIPEYIFLGFKESRKLVFGDDLLEKFDFEISKESVKKSAMKKIISHKIQLDRIPLVYNLEEDIDLLFNESLSHAKNLMYFMVELLMTDEELKDRRFLELYKDKEELLDFFSSRKPDLEETVITILESKEKYGEWKEDKERAKEIYLAAYGLIRNSFSQT